MQYLGLGLSLLGLVGLVFGFIQHHKAERILAAPFRRTGELARVPGVADAKGIVSCEGSVRASLPVLAPCSGRPCVYFEIEVGRKWSKQVMTENGTKTEKGSETVQTVRAGSVFYVDDGSGPVAVDPRAGMDVDLEESFAQEQNIAYGNVRFGQFQTVIEPPGGEKRGYAVTVTERIVPVEGGMFVMGQLANACIGKPQGALGKLRASRKGRTALLGSTNRNATIGFVLAGVLFVPGAGLAAFALPPAAPVAGESACNILDESKSNDWCSGKIYDDSGSNVPFTVSQAGSFEITAGPPRAKKIPVIAAISIMDERGKALVTHAEGHAALALAPGKYSINVKDAIPGDVKHMKGGFSYELFVKRISVVAAASASASAAHATPAVASAAAVPRPLASTAAKPAVKAANAKPSAAKK